MAIDFSEFQLWGDYGPGEDEAGVHARHLPCPARHYFAEEECTIVDVMEWARGHAAICPRRVAPKPVEETPVCEWLAKAATIGRLIAELGTSLQAIPAGDAPQVPQEAPRRPRSAPLRGALGLGPEGILTHHPQVHVTEYQVSPHPIDSGLHRSARITVAYGSSWAGNGDSGWSVGRDTKYLDADGVWELDDPDMNESYDAWWSRHLFLKETALGIALKASREEWMRGGKS